MYIYTIYSCNSVYMHTFVSTRVICVLLMVHLNMYVCIHTTNFSTFCTFAKQCLCMLLYTHTHICMYFGFIYAFTCAIYPCSKLDCFRTGANRHCKFYYTKYIFVPLSHNSRIYVTGTNLDLFLLT